MSIFHEVEKSMDFGGMWGRKQRKDLYTQTMNEMLGNADEIDLERALTAKRQNAPTAP